MTLSKTHIVLVILLTSALSFAQNEETVEKDTISPINKTLASFEINGSIDTYFRKPEFAPNTAFANLNGFALGMINIILSHEAKKYGFVADLVYGPRGAESVFNSSGSSNIINQLYIYYNVNKKLKLTLGNFNTFLGYEVISPVNNFNYSTSYLFSYGPFSHTGVKADITLSEKTSLMLGILNQTDYTESNYLTMENGDRVAFKDYMYGAQLGISDQYLNLLAGKEYVQIDFTGGFNTSANFFLGINTSITLLENDAQFFGVALYPQLSLSDSFDIGLRGEYFTEAQGGVGALYTGVLKGLKKTANNTAITLTGNYTHTKFILKPELRIDFVSDKIYSKNTSEFTDHIASFVLVAVYSF